MKIKITDKVRKPYDKYIGWEFEADYQEPYYIVCMKSPFTEGAMATTSPVKKLYLTIQEVEVLDASSE